MTWKAFGAFEAWANANNSLIHADAVDETAMGFVAGWNAALASNDCIPREVAERLARWVEKMAPARGKYDRNSMCLFCGSYLGLFREHAHIAGCDWVEARAALAALDKALEGSK